MITHAGCWENTRKAVRYYIETSVLLEDIPLVKFIKKLHLGPKWFISMFIDDSDYYLYLSPGGEGGGRILVGIT